MRGTHTGRVVVEYGEGIIPAYAGNTRSFGVLSCLARDHPRVCGEHGRRVGGQDGFRGSSPRMRGTRRFDFEDSKIAGIIPAYAGNTEYERSLCPMCGDHPRVCGEH